MLAITGASAALALSEIPFEKTDRRRARRPGRRRVRHQPDLRRSASRARSTSSSPARKDGIVMVEAGAKEVTEDAGGRRARSRARRDQADRRGHRRPARRRSARRSCAVAAKAIDPAFYREVEEQGARAARRGDAHQGQARELRARSTRCSRTTARGAARGRRRAARRDAEAHLPRAEGEGRCATRSLERGVRLDGRKFDEIRPIWIEIGVLPRVHGSAVFTRGETQALVTVHARHRRRPAEDRDGRRRDVEALHAALQLPAVLGRRSEVRCAAPAAARSATARSPSARSRR